MVTKTKESLNPTMESTDNVKAGTENREDCRLTQHSTKLSLSEIRKAIPSKAFEKNLMKSSFYMAFDFTLLVLTYYAFFSLVESSYWQLMPTFVKICITIIYWNLAGLFMWCQFVIGHDCGHGNFSNYEIVNDILGHISHGSLLVPYWPWQVIQLK